ncbi:MAG: MarR family transcriptional regulator [Actinomycetota bacterium]|nr:MarR family transcriptional regulator [Actinomycetota bacterium]
MIEKVSRSAPALAPLFRSDQQLAILAVLFADGAADIPIVELARRAGVAKATASREVARLAEHGLVVTSTLGRNTLVTANWDLPWANELRSILVQTVGVMGRLSGALSTVDGVEKAYIFGSWAARYEGEAGPPPRDIDVVVVGDAALRNVRRACRAIEDELRVEVNPVVIDRGRWEAKRAEPFIAQIKNQPHVPIPLER